MAEALTVATDYSRYIVSEDWNADSEMTCRTCEVDFAWTGWRDSERWTLADMMRLADEHEAAHHTSQKANPA